MSDPTAEEKLPFKYNLETITEEILAGGKPRELEGPFADPFEEHIERFVDKLGALEERQILLSLSRRELSENLADFQRVVVNHYIVAYTSKHTNAFAGWNDTERRHLLDLALGADISEYRVILDKEEAKGEYFSPPDPDTVRYSKGRITHLQNIRKKLRARVSPSSPQERK